MSVPVQYAQRFSLATPLALLITAGLFVLLVILTSEPVRYILVAPIKPPEFRPLSDRQPPPDPPEPRRKPVEPVIGGNPLPVPTPVPTDPRFQKPTPNDPWIYHGPGPTGPPVTRIDARDPIVVLPPRPAFPERARAEGIEGHVIVAFTVTAAGTIRDLRIVEAEPAGWFEKAAMAAASRLRYQPRLVEGQPVEAPGMMYKFVFDLED
jgi:protein TonB